MPNSRGYLRVELKNNGELKRCFVHRLVATHFVENSKPQENNVVNHIDGNFLNNNSDNLEWTTQYGNMHHAIANGKMIRTKQWLRNLRKTQEKLGKSVVGTNITTGEKVHFVCLNDCAQNGFYPSCVSLCCRGKRETHKGYIWDYA